jgi:class 3 adenylate cyclase
MDDHESNIDRLLEARAKIDEELRQHKSLITILFTDVVGSTEYFDRYGDTAGMGMLHRHSELTMRTTEEFQGRVIKTIGDSVMAEFSEPALGVRAAVEVQRRLLALNQKLPDRERLQLRIGLNHGPAMRSGTDVYGDAVNLAARITKHTGPAQILVSQSVRSAVASEPSLHCRCLGKITFKGKAEQEEVFEVIWTEGAIYADLQATVTAAIARGDLVSPGLSPEDLIQRAESTPSTPVEQPVEESTAPRPLESIEERYEILGQLGRGGMGSVYKARDRETNEIVALKFIKPEIAAQPEVIDHFKTELRLARKITHKNVCRTYEMLRFGDSVVIAMEYVEGETLRAFLDRYGSAPLRRGLEWVIQISQGLAEAHEQGIVHRDLKPENIMIDKLGRAKVMDFGIACSIDQTGATGAIVGTPAYMSPEQAEGKPADARSDIYSLGLILYEMFTGQAAFSADTPTARALKQTQEPIPANSSFEHYLPDFLDGVIQKCLEKNPAKRLQSAKQLESALRQKTIFEHQAIEPKMPGHLLISCRSDFILVALGLIGLAGFILLAPETIPEMGVRTRVTRGMLLEKARDELASYGWKASSDSLLRIIPDDEPYTFLAKRFGYGQAKRAIAGEAPPFLYHVVFPEPGKGNNYFDRRAEIAGVWFEPDGSIQEMYVPVKGWVHGGNGLPYIEALELAKQSIKKTLGVDTSRMEMENHAPIVTDGHQGTTLQWTVRQPTGIVWHYQADIYDRPTLLTKSFTLPEDYILPHPLLNVESLFVVWTVLAFVFFLTKRLYSEIRIREVVVFAVVAFLSFEGPLSTQEEIFGGLLVVAAATTWLTILTLVLIYLVRRPWPYILDSYLALVRLRPQPSATGLALMRGISCGLVITGIYSLLVRLASSARLAQPELTLDMRDLNSILPNFLKFIAILSVTYAYGYWLTLARRWIASTSVLVIVGGLVGVAAVRFTLPLNGFELFLGFAAGTGFSFVMLTYDLLTLTASVYTFSLWKQGYVLTKVFQTVNNLQYWIAFLFWGAVFAWAMFVAFRPQWERGGRKIARALD